MPGANAALPNPQIQGKTGVVSICGIKTLRHLLRGPVTVAVLLLLTGAALAAAPGPKAAVEDEDAGIPSETNDNVKPTTGLPIPRFVSLRTNPINLRTGPGVRYPVDWVYVRRNLPVEVIAEYETWRRIRDPDGAEGWVHQSMLSGKRTVVVTGTAQALKRTNVDNSEVVATLDAGVVANLIRCPTENAFCRVEINGLQGWLKRGQFWGVYPSEAVQ